MTTPTQLAKWREEFAKAEGFTFSNSEELENIINRRFPRTFDGYCLAKQETEQAIKDACKQALEEAIGLCKNACYIYPTDEHRKAHNGGAEQCEKKIKELLNDTEHPNS